MSAPDTAASPFPTKEQVEAALRPFAQQQQHNLGMTTQVLPGVSGALTFNAAALTGSVPDLYMSTHRQ